VRGRYSLKNIPPKKARRKDKFTRVMTGKNILGKRCFIGTQCKIFLFIIEVRKRGGGIESKHSGIQVGQNSCNGENSIFAYIFILHFNL